MDRLKHIASVAAGWFPLTGRGLVVAGSGLALHFYVGEAMADRVAYGAGSMLMWAVGLVAGVTLLATLRVLLSVRQIRGESDERLLNLPDLETGAPRRTGLEVPGLGWWPFVQLSVRWRRPHADVTLEPGIGRGTLSERITPRRRGRYSEIIREICISDMFGLTAIRAPLRYRANLVVSPPAGRYSMSLAMRQSAGEGFSHPDGSAVGERADMRRYAAGDPSRFILWKAYARSRKLLVRTPERALSPEPSTVAFLIAGEGDAEAAATARKFIDEGLLGDSAVFTADGASSPADTNREALEQIVDSAAHQDRGGTGLSTLLSHVGRAQLSNCVVFAPSKPGPWEEQLIAFNRQLPAPATIIMSVSMSEAALNAAVKGSSDEGPKRWRQLLWAPPAKDPQLDDQSALVKRLQQEGMEVRLVHQGTGKLLDPALLPSNRRGVREAA